MGEKANSRITGGAGAVAALAAVSTVFAGAGLIGPGVGSLDLWPDWSGTLRPSVDVAALPPGGPGVNPLLPLAARTDGSRPLGGATANIFVSSPGSVTPFHFDPEHNILLQLRGTKTMTVFPAADEAVVAGIEHERFHIGGHRNLPWHDTVAAKGHAFDLTPGRGIYVPVKAPHWVKNGPDVSVSFSVTWRSEWSYAEADARAMNATLRRLGLNPRSPGRHPEQNMFKATSYRALRKFKLT